MMTTLSPTNIPIIDELMAGIGEMHMLADIIGPDLPDNAVVILRVRAGTYAAMLHTTLIEAGFVPDVADKDGKPAFSPKAFKEFASQHSYILQALQGNADINNQAVEADVTDPMEGDRELGSAKD